MQTSSPRSRWCQACSLVRVHTNTSTDGPDLTDEAEAQNSSQAVHLRPGILYIASGTKGPGACFEVAPSMLRACPSRILADNERFCL
jgi:hypothetical protein